MNELDLTVVTRHFCKGSTDKRKAAEVLVEAIRRLFSGYPRKKSIRIVLNTDSTTDFAELRDENNRYANEALIGGLISQEKEMDDIHVQFVYCNHWGFNSGSARAINDGVFGNDKSACSSISSELILCWSKEMSITGEELNFLVTEFVKRSNCRWGGFTRAVKFHFKGRPIEKTNPEEVAVQHKVIQNTCSLYFTRDLIDLGGFNSKYCDGHKKKEFHLRQTDLEQFFLAYQFTSDEQVELKRIIFDPKKKGEEPLVAQGMEDFLFQLNLSLKYGPQEYLIIDSGIPWIQNLEEYDKLLKAIRQPSVMNVWLDLVNESGPDHNKLTLGQFISRGKIINSKN